ncbi:MAG: hypothetical protein WCF57_17780 [Pyrinomonadaceae bacterium]
MTSWMKRRIQRSRARCHRTLVAHKRTTAERNKSKSQADKQTATTSRARHVL